MDDEIKSKLLEWIERIENAADQGGAFIVAEAPKVASEYLASLWWESSLGVVAGVAPCLFCCLPIESFGQFQLPTRIWIAISRGG